METTPSDLSEQLTKRVHTELHNVWSFRKQACCSPKSGNYHLYGARGIRMDARWVADSKAFIRWSLRAGFIPGKRLVRLDVKKGFTPSNCAWVVPRDQWISQAKRKPVTAVDEEGNKTRFDSVIEAAEWVVEEGLSKTKRVNTVYSLIGNTPGNGGKAYGLTWWKGSQQPSSQTQPKKDLTGRKFSLLTVRKLYKSTPQGSVWECRCKCGNRIRVRSDQLTSGRTTSCGVKSMHED